LPNIPEMIEAASETLRRSGIAEPRREAASLLALALQRSRTFLIARSEYVPTAAESSKYAEFIERRAKREPFQHIAGRQEFWGLDFIVTKDVLIPRPETELLVETALGVMQTLDAPRFCEVGVGSGCIAVALLHETERAAAVGLDISDAALRIAERNAVRNRVADRLELRRSDVFAALGADERFGLIISNPPYVAAADIPTLQPEVRDFDPLNALTDGADGLSIIRAIAAHAPRHLTPGGALLLEIGFDQAAEVRAMFAPELWREPEFLPDLRGIARTVRVFRK
jgi:release factor glutamine methyltransferase